MEEDLCVLVATALRPGRVVVVRIPAQLTHPLIHATILQHLFSPDTGTAHPHPPRHPRYHFTAFI